MLPQKNPTNKYDEEKRREGKHSGADDVRDITRRLSCEEELLYDYYYHIICINIGFFVVVVVHKYHKQMKGKRILKKNK